MKIPNTLPACLLIVLLFYTPDVHAQSAQPEKTGNYLISTIHYITAMEAKEACASTLSSPNVAGGPVLASGAKIKDILKLSDIKVIEVISDPLILPSPLVTQALLDGKLVNALTATKTDDAVRVEIRFKNKECYALTFFPISLPSRINSGDAWIGVPQIPANCSTVIYSLIKPGMSRVDFEKWVHADGGITIPLRQERYVLDDCEIGDQAIKLNVAFKPANMTDNVFLSGQWSTARQAPDDILMRVSPPYVQTPFFD